MQLPLHEARGDLASVELLEEMCSTPGCSCTAPGLWGLAGPWHGFAQSTVRSRQDRAVHAWSTLAPSCNDPQASYSAQSSLLPWLVDWDSLGVKPQLSHWCPSPLQQIWPEAEEKTLHKPTPANI